MPNIYDRIFKENILPLIPALAAKTMGLKIGKTEDLKDKMQVTLEGEADFLQKLLHDNASEDFILHIEFQTDNHPKMLQRMLLYRAFAYSVHSLPVKQFVIYSGNKPVNMQSSLSQDNLDYAFEVINIADFDYETFIHSSQPEEVVLAILCNFKGRKPREIIREILNQLGRIIGKNKGRKISKYISQLEILAQLRNLREEVQKEEQQMPYTYDLENDLRYKQGAERGIEKGILIGKEQEKYSFVKNLVLDTDFDDSKIANLVGVSEVFVANIRKELG